MTKAYENPGKKEASQLNKERREAKKPLFSFPFILNFLNKQGCENKRNCGEEFYKNVD
jgi:hypothetical protein